MITQPRFLDEPEPEPEPEPQQPAPRSSEQEKAGGAEEVPLETPRLLDHDPLLPDSLTEPTPAEAIPEAPSDLKGFGLGVVILGLLSAWIAIYAISFVIQEYRVAHYLGYAAGVVLMIALGILTTYLVREIISWRTLGEIARLRSVLASPLSSRENVAAAAGEWLALIPKTVALPDNARNQIGSYRTADEIRGYLKTRIAPVLDEAVSAYTQSAITQITLLTAVSPRILWDGLGAIFRSVVLIRQIAKLYGIRPGLATTAVLFRHIIITAVATGAAVTVMNQAFVTISKIHPAVDDLMMKTGLGGAEATRICQLAVMTAKSCNPLER